MVTICFYLGYANLSGLNYGSELAFLKLVNQMQKKAKIYLVSLFPNQPSNLGFTVLTPQEYLIKTFDVLIISRYINFFLYLPIRAPKVYIWLHDIGLQPYYNGQSLPAGGGHLLDNVIYDGIVAQTDWHKNTFIQGYPGTDDRISVIGNGIDTEKFQNRKEKINGKFIYTSSPKRGLTYLLSVFEKIHHRWPFTKLYIYRGPEEFTQSQLETINKMKGYVFYQGLLSNDNLAEEFLTSHIWLYSTDFSETYCISALEAQMAGCICICSNLAALIETVGDRGVLLQKPFGSFEFEQEIITAITKVFSGELSHLSEKAKVWGSQQDWSNRADQWFKLINAQSFPDCKIEPFSNNLTKKTLGLSSNWTTSLSKEWANLIPENYPYQIQDNTGDHQIVINGLFSRPQEKEDICVFMEPECNRGHLPGWTSSNILKRNMIEWHLNKKYDQLILPSIIPKIDRISMIISAEQRLPGHQNRHNLADALDITDLPIDIYGRHNKPFKKGKGSLQYKDSGLEIYKYHIAIENCSETGYFTEKLADSILSECLTFYWGCPDIDRYIDPRALVILNPSSENSNSPSPFNILTSLTLIRQALQEDWYSQRLPFIRQQKQRMLQWSVFPTFERYFQYGPEIYPDTFVVNLDRRIDRWNNIITRLAGVTYRRKSAVDGQTLKLDTKQILFGNIFSVKDIFTVKQSYQKNPYGGHNFRMGVIGCALSHLQIWDGASRSKNYTRVFEDDIKLSEKFHLLYPLLHKWLETNSWDLFFLGYTDDQPIYKDEKIFTLKKEGNKEEKECDQLAIHRFNPSSRRVNGGGTFAYCISPKGAFKLLSLVKQFGIGQPIDWFMIEMFTYTESYKCFPHLVTSSVNEDTDIQRDGKVIS